MSHEVRVKLLQVIVTPKLHQVPANIIILWKSNCSASKNMVYLIFDYTLYYTKKSMRLKDTMV